jgi:Predicted permease/Heavy metal binding domain
MIGTIAGVGAHALDLAVSMTWEILLALILGFALSAAVQALVSKREMTRLLPDDSPRSVAIACGLGAASSSCSYAAVGLVVRFLRTGGPGMLRTMNERAIIGEAEHAGHDGSEEHHRASGGDRAADGDAGVRAFVRPMHPDVRSEGPGRCPRCGMDLEPEAVTLEEDR